MSSSDYSSLAYGVSSGVMIVSWLISIVVSVIIVISMWKIFTKAGEAGWKAIIPFYNIWVFDQLTCNNNILVFILTLIPVTSVVGFCIAYFGLGKAFGKGVGFSILCILFPYIAIPVLAFSSAEYTGDKVL